MVLTRFARKARNTQWTRDAVLNNPDLLRLIAEQADLPTACKLLTTSKHNFVGGADFFDKQYAYSHNQLRKSEHEAAQLEYDAGGFYELQPVEFHILDNESTQVFLESEVIRIRLRSLKAYLELLCDYFGVKNTAFDEDRKKHGIACSRYCPCEPDPERTFDCNCGTTLSYCIKCGDLMDCPNASLDCFEKDSLFDSESDSEDEV